MTIKEENIQYPVEVRPEIVGFQDHPLALSYNSCWYMFGMRPWGGRAPCIFIAEPGQIRVLDVTVDPPEDFRLDEITSDFRNRFPVSDDYNDRDDRLQYLLSSNQSMYKIF